MRHAGSIPVFPTLRDCSQAVKASGLYPEDRRFDPYQSHAVDNQSKGEIMNKWVKRKWLRALRSGEYRKGMGTLGIREGNEYCCLGVLVCEMVPEFTHEEMKYVGVGDPHKDFCDYYDEDYYDEIWIPDDLAALWGLDKDIQRKLGKINDDNTTFDPVIAYIEENL